MLHSSYGTYEKEESVEVEEGMNVCRQQERKERGRKEGRKEGKIGTVEGKEGGKEIRIQNKERRVKFMNIKKKGKKE